MDALVEKEKPMFDKNIPCDGCSEADFLIDVKAPALWNCKECNDNLCEQCRDAHKRTHLIDSKINLILYQL